MDELMGLPLCWRQVAQRLKKEVHGFEERRALIEALSAMDKDAVWDALADDELTFACEELLYKLMR